MFTKVFTILVVASVALAAPRRSVPGECEPGSYRCDPTLTSIETCDQFGWHLAGDCQSNTCAVNPVDGVPYCHDVWVAPTPSASASAKFKSSFSA